VRGRDAGTGTGGGVPDEPVDAAGVLEAAGSPELEGVPELDAEVELGPVCELGGVVLGRGVTGRRERLATTWKSPVSAMARDARSRRAKAYGSDGFCA
jgi:hypothetical protein